ncbi:MAG TPA: argininosuccinate lyase [Candidatus Ornithomonoglobus intestinigallinarum]|uniref:Argininosuccinate lyase n=1 Tax=Candidatus Ornithomonoglobus intestinigallinarum TaxID=2840894 RepID=A0A9D1KPY6_9FIRM|nr:argininosuccinate lyase [Candidatus Ornithomonoglobus intestinigallinarum]
MAKLWGGRFQKSTDKKVDDFNSSIRFDKRMYKQDIKGSMAHAAMLGRCGIIPEEDSRAIIDELKNILKDIEDGKVEFLIDAEDIHMNIEKLLTDRIGDAGKRLHTGRSRNDQVALDIRMYLMDETEEIRKMLLHAMDVITELASEHTETIMPGYTHLQKAQPVTFAHHLMAYFEMLKRDFMRLDDCRGRTNVMPLGSGALAATTYPLDRYGVAKELGFDGVTMNSLDGVSDRDFVIELASCLSILMMHLSRFCEELILWSSHEFSFVEMDDAFSTGSSIMPQKKNPDVAELIRGKTGRVYGHLMGLLTTMKGLPLAYNKDMQEDKEPIFDSIDTVKLCLPVFCDMIATMTVKKDNMLKGAKGGFTNATDVADYLVKKGLPFREAHGVVGRMVYHAVTENKDLDDFTMEEFKSFSDIIEEDIYDAISMETCVNGRSVVGGPAKETVEAAIAEARKFAEQYKKE